MRAGVYEARKRTPRPSVVYGGDGARGKKVAASLTATPASSPSIQDRCAWPATEPFALLMGELAYGGRGGPALAYRFERLREQG